MNRIQVTCDSTCDLTPELYAAYGIRAVPLGVTLGDDLRHDGVDVTAAELFDYAARSGSLPKTSAVSVGEYLEVFRGFVDAGCEVLHISLSSRLSSSHQNARLAAGKVGHVTVVDSLNLSSASGLLALLAAELARSGMGVEEIASVLEEARGRLDASFVLQTLEYLHKGGRCSGVAAFGANLMKLRPEIVVADGSMRVGRKYRGDLDRSVTAYVRGRLEGRTDVQTDRVMITHSGVPQATLDRVTALVRELQPFEEVLVTDAGCTISSHCGPNCLGVLFFRKGS